MYVLNDNYGNCYVRENGKIVSRRSGESALFESREEAEKAVAEYIAESGCLSPVWWELL